MAHDTANSVVCVMTHDTASSVWCVMTHNTASSVWCVMTHNTASSVVCVTTHDTANSVMCVMAGHYTASSIVCVIKCDVRVMTEHKTTNTAMCVIEERVTDGSRHDMQLKHIPMWVLARESSLYSSLRILSTTLEIPVTIFFRWCSKIFSVLHNTDTLTWPV